MSFDYPLVGIERLTLDYHLSVDACPNIESQFKTTESIKFISESEWLTLKEECGPFANCQSGGNVGNCLAAYQGVLGEHNEALRAYWCGVYSSGQDSSKVLRSLAETGIEVQGYCGEGASTKTLIVSAGPGEKRRAAEHRIVVCTGRWPALVQESAMPVAKDVMLCVGLDSLLDEQFPSNGMFLDESSPMVLLVNHSVSDDANLDQIKDVLESNRVIAIIGTQKELNRLGEALEKPWTEWSTSWGCEVLGTCNANGVVSYPSGSSDPLQVPARDVASENIASSVGAGDTFAGAYVAFRRLGRSMLAALTAATAKAAESLNYVHARPPRLTLVQAACGKVIQDPDIERLVDIRQQIEWSSGPAILSGGQTGVDQIVLEQATRLGLAAHGILPQGLRIEGGGLTAADLLRLGSPAIHELAHPGYKARTWASAFLGDATLLFAFRDSEGALETERACRTLDRPLFVISGSDWRIDHLLNFLGRHDVAVLNIAGHRGSFLSPDETNRVRTALNLILQAWAAAFAQRHPPCELARLIGDVPKPSGVGTRRETSELLVGIPSAGMMHRVVMSRLNLDEDCYREASRRLRIRVPQLGCVLILGRPRDMAVWLNERRVDAVVGGLDELTEGGVSGYVAYDSGLFRSAISVLKRDDSLEEGPKSHLLLLSQIPTVARRLLAPYRNLNVTIREINGVAESWLRLGYGYGCVDTVHTGQTAKDNSLQPWLTLGETSMCLVARHQLSTPKQATLSQIVYILGSLSKSQESCWG